MPLGFVTFLGSAALAGLAFGVADLVRACWTSSEWIGKSSAVALLGLWIWFGQFVGIGLWLARCLAAVIKARLQSRLAWQTLLSLAAGGLTLLLARKVFAGAGIRGTIAASWGAWAVPLAVTLTAWVALWIAARVVEGGWRKSSKWATIALAAGLALGSVVLEAYAVSGYLYLHVLLLTSALVLGIETTELIRLPKFVGHAALTGALVTLPALLAFPATLQARELLAQPTWAGLQLIGYAQHHMDFDGDGRSPVFGGGDCNDRDASVFVGAPEKAADGRDSDCDGFDDPQSSSLVFAPFDGLGAERAAKLFERAKNYPTVVILVDALRFDRVGSARFPELAQLQRESIQFTHVYSTSSSTATSVPAMVTGRVRPARRRESIAQALTRAQQQSVFIAPDVVEEHLQRKQEFDALSGFSSRKIVPTNHASGWGLGDTVPTSDQITAAAVELLDSAVPPDLYWLHYFDQHQWNALEDRRLPAFNDVARYDAVLEQLDASLRPLLERRDRVNLILLADHGEGLGARGVKYHTALNFEELTHVPVLVRIPGADPETVDIPLSSTGLFNTLRTLRGLEPDPTAEPGWLSLVGATNPGNGPGFAGFEEQQWSLLYGNHRLLYRPQQQLLELYDLARDPRAQKDLARENPQLAARLLARLFELNNAPRD